MGDVDRRSRVPTWWNVGPAPHPSPRRSMRRFGSMLVVVAGMLAASTMVWKASTAAFTATTSNGTNTFSAGTVTLSDSDNGTAMFSPGGLAPGGTGSACIRVTYGGSLAAAVKLYTASLSDAQGLGSYVNMTIEQGTTSPANAAGTFPCTNFTPSTTIATGTLAQLGTHTTYAAGYGSWAPTAAGQTKDYKFTWDLSASTPDSVQNASVSLAFVWEAQST